MLAAILSLPIYVLALIVYYLLVGWMMLDGATKELLGHRHSGHQNLHRVLWQFHSGQHINRQRSYGDERRLRRTANSSNRATPEGAIVYFTKLNRWQRALRNNLFVMAFWALVYGLIYDGKLTVQAIAAGMVVACCALMARIVVSARQRHRGRPARRIDTPELAKVGATPKALFVAGGTVTEEKPRMDGGVPQQVLAMLIADTLGCSSAETAARLTLSNELGTLALPDHFPALTRQRDVIEEIVAAQNSAKLKFRWSTSAVPRVVTWIPVVNTLPVMVPFREYTSKLERLRPGEFGVGLTMERSLYVTSHNGDTPWHLRSAGSGSGKSTGFQVKLAQICRNDPEADVYCWDTKQVSFTDMHGIPGVTIYDDPVTGLGRMWDGFYAVAGILRDRATAVRKRQATVADFNDIWILVDEGNDLAAQFKNYYEHNIKASGMPAQPLVWAEAIASLVYLGRQFRIRGEMMFQNMTDRVLGGVSLRDAFGITGMAGYKKNQWTRIIGTSPAEECRYGPGKICMINGPQHTWVQGFYDEPDWLRSYALAGRQGRSAA